MPHRTATERRRGPDDFAGPRRYADLHSIQPTSAPMSQRSTSPLPRNAPRLAAAAIASAVFVLLAGCSAPVLAPDVTVPDHFAAAGAQDVEPEAAWWESYGD